MKTAIFLAEGFEEIEALTVVDLLRRVKITCDMISTDDDILTGGSHGIKVKADYLLSEINFEEYDCMILPGGWGAADAMAADPRIAELVRY